MKQVEKFQGKHLSFSNQKYTFQVTLKNFFMAAIFQNTIGELHLCRAGITCSKSTMETRQRVMPAQS